jgi:hypothetical protein
VTAGRHVGNQVGIREAVAFDRLADRHRNSPLQHRTRRHEGVKLAVLAAGIGAGRQLGEQRMVEPAPGEALR